MKSILVLLGIVLIFLYIKKRFKKNNNIDQNTKCYVLRAGKSVEADEVFCAWQSNNLKRMLKAMEIKTNSIDRHYLLLGIVEKTYKYRNDPKMRALCKEVGQKHIYEFEAIAPVLKKDGNGVLPNVPTFKSLAILLTEDGDYDDAIKVCQIALKYGLGDGTKKGFAGRIERIKNMIKRD